MANDLDRWLALVTSQHSDKPKFMATLTTRLQPYADMIALLEGMSAAFDLDTAVGAQLDAVGLWLDVTRTLMAPITGVYFAWDTANVGWDQGSWYQVGESTSYLTALPDDAFRNVIRARIAVCHWDGTMSGAYAAWAIAFAGTPYGIQIVETGSMAITITLTGVPDAVTKAMFEGGYLALKPAGVTTTCVVRGY
jgi:hypothetical protein